MVELFYFIGVNMNSKPFKTIDEQINILESRGMIVDHDKAKNSLMRNGYYNVINGYKDFFLEDDNKFIPGTRFYDLDTLFQVDKLLSKAFFSSSLDIERMFKTNLAYFLSEKFGEKEEEYLNTKNYITGRNIEKNVWQIDKTIDIFKNLISENIEPITHYRKKYNNVPPWILFTRATFGNVYYLYKLCKGDIKTKVISSMLKVSPDCIDNLSKQVFSDIILLILQFRNRTAHANRTYNFEIKASNSFLPYSEAFYMPFNIDKAAHKNNICRTNAFAFIASIYYLDKNNYLLLREQVVQILNFYKSVQAQNYKQFLLALGIPNDFIDIKIEKILPSI